MSGKGARRLLGLVIGVAVLVAVASVAYEFGVRSGNGATQTVFGPMRGYGRMVGFDTSYGLWGLIPLLLIGLFVFGLIVVLATPSGRSASSTGPSASSAGVEGLQQLTEMHNRSELTDEEFSAAKRRLLGL